LQAFHEKHPDFPLRGVFYILPDSAFGQPRRAAEKVRALIAAGFEIGNHTVSHGHLKRLSDAEAQKEMAEAVRKIRVLAPEARVESIALPFGESPKNRALLASGTSGGTSYRHRAAMLVGSNPAPSPVSRKFDPMRLPRIQAIAGAFGLDYWLNWLKEHPEKRYVSDGDPATVTVPRALQQEVDAARLQGATLRTYN